MTVEEDINRAKADVNRDRDIAALQDKLAEIERTMDQWRSRITKAGLGMLGLVLVQTEPGSKVLQVIAALLGAG